jgi:hypothetical protein
MYLYKTKYSVVFSQRLLLSLRGRLCMWMQTWVSLGNWVRPASCKRSSSLLRSLLNRYLFTSHSMGPTVTSLLLFVDNSKRHDITSPWCQGVISDDNISLLNFN